MRRSHLVTLSLFLFQLLGFRALLAQESAFFYSLPAVRFEQASGIFHYIIPCKVTTTGIPVAGGVSSPDMLPALCWPVAAVLTWAVDGKQQSSAPVYGLLRVTASLVQFTPNNTPNSDLKQQFPVDKVIYQHGTGNSAAVIGTKEIAYKFSFTNICIGCTPGAPPLDPNKGAQLDAEYSLIGDSLKDFAGVSKRINELSEQMRFGVTPANQPTPQDRPEAMGLYSDLNRRFAELCPEPAKSCVQSYEKYQACESGASPANCGQPPACSAFCALTPQAYTSLKASICIPKANDFATLNPDWSNVFRKEDAARAANPAPQVNPASQAAPAANSPTTGSGCGVGEGYTAALRSHVLSSPVPPVSGQVAGMTGMVGSSPPPGALSQSIAVSAGVIAANKISGASPVYPAVAKAARVQGTVVLTATISKSGDVEDLRVIAGPALLQKAALDAVETWKYRPYLLNGAPVKVMTQINVVFLLGGPAPAQQPPATAAPGDPPNEE